MAEQQGPMMIVATDALAAPKVRIGKIGGNFTLPRTIPLASLAAGGVGVFLGLMVAVIFFGATISSIMYCSVLSGAAGILVVTYSPLKGESLSRWLGLRIKTRRRQLKLDGDVVQIAVGVALLKSATLGQVHLRPSAVNIPPSQFDERGVAIDPDDILRGLLTEHGVNTDHLGTSLRGSVPLSSLEEQEGFRRRGSFHRFREVIRQHAIPVSPDFPDAVADLDYDQITSELRAGRVGVPPTEYQDRGSSEPIHTAPTRPVAAAPRPFPPAAPLPPPAPTPASPTPALEGFVRPTTPFTDPGLASLFTDPTPVAGEPSGDTSPPVPVSDGLDDLFSDAPLASPTAPPALHPPAQTSADTFGPTQSGPTQSGPAPRVLGDIPTSPASPRPPLPDSDTDDPIAAAVLEDKWADQDDPDQDDPDETTDAPSGPPRGSVFAHPSPKLGEWTSTDQPEPVESPSGWTRPASVRP